MDVDKDTYQSWEACTLKGSLKKVRRIRKKRHLQSDFFLPPEYSRGKSFWHRKLSEKPHVLQVVRYNSFKVYKFDGFYGIGRIRYFLGKYVLSSVSGTSRLLPQ